MRERENDKKKPNELFFGIRAVIEAIRAGKDVEKVLVQQDLRGPLLTELRKTIKQYGIPSQNVPENRLKYIDGNHQGVIAYLSPIEFFDIDDLLAGIYERGENPFLLIADRINDVRNFGAICRSAECAGVHAIIIPAKGSAEITADAVKTSAGALMRIPVCRVKSLPALAENLKNSGIQLISCTEKTERSMTDANLKGPLAIIVGNEEVGISSTLLNLSDQCVKIPLKGEIGSLNVSVAAGIIVFEALRQRDL
jgi:23S rRNA (guanosine2251-2'-O)-methyltransferase